MAIKLEINMTNKWLYSLIAVGILLALGVGVYAYQSNMRAGNPPVMGHSAGEINVENSAGEIVSLQDALDDLASSSGRQSITFEVYNSDTSTYECVDKNLQDLCGDEDGCDIRILMQHENDGNDQVRIIDEHIFMEQSSMSNNRGSGTYGWTRQSGGGDYSWITGAGNRYTIFSPWDWVWMLNYRHDYCPGQSGHGSAWDDHYKFTFMSHPHVRTKVIVYD